MTYHDLLERMNDQPFKPFRIKTLNNTVYEIREPWMILVGDSSAVIAYETQPGPGAVGRATRFRTVSISHMIEMEDLAEPKRPQAKRKPA